MGFRDMNLFNIAILARQSWRLIQRPDSLIARLLKAKYHPNTDLMEAEVGSCPSYTWRSIMDGRDALGLGLVRSVGNGADIQVWKDKWIPRPQSFTPTRIGGDVDLSLRVVDLIDWAQNRWDEEKVRGIFNVCDVDLILKIPLGDAADLDEWRWFYRRDGVFSVRSAYHLLFDRKWEEEHAERDGSSSSGRDMERLWKHIWKIETLPRVRSLVWRAYKDILPTMVNLRRRGVPVEVFCRECGKFEIGFHALFSCPRARLFWAQLPDVEQWGKKAGSVVEFFSHCTYLLSASRLADWAVVLWSVWLARNKKIFEGLDVDPIKDVQDGVAGNLSMARSALHVHVGLADGCGGRKWSKPPEGFFKVNCDASYSETRGSSVGFVIRDDNGEIRALGAKKIGDVPDVEFAEVEAIRWGISESLNMGLQQLVVESDCLPAISKLRNRKVGLGVASRVLRTVVSMSRNLGTCSWSHVRREANQFAHYLASLKPSSPIVCFSVDVFPFSVDRVVDVDSG